jgi:hypothetical protein
MSAAKRARLAERGVVSVTGHDSEKLLQGLVTNDVDDLGEGEARHAGLLSPQGKIIFDFFVVRHGEGYLLDVRRSMAVDLVKRLTMYKLRADVSITDVSESFTVTAAWGNDSKSLSEGRGIAFQDPRQTAIGLRLLEETTDTNVAAITAEPADDSRRAGHAYDALRVDLGVPEGSRDYEYGDTYPHEADFDLFHGVSFKKGCYVGQEIVARMQNKTVVRKRIIKINGSGPLVSGSDIFVGEIAIGRVGTVAGNNAIAMLRLDRALEAEQKNQKLTAGGVGITPDQDAIDRYRSSAAAKASTALP